MFETPQGPFCQSCGMPLARDEQGGGTNADGSHSTTYCSHCYENGQFTHPDLTVDQMMANVKTRLHSQGVPPEMAERLVSFTPRLQRWKA